MPKSGNSVIPGGGSRDRGQVGTRHVWQSEDCRRPMWPSRVSQGQQEVLGSKSLWRLNGHLGPSPGQVSLSYPTVWGLHQCPCPPSIHMANWVTFVPQKESRSPTVGEGWGRGRPAVRPTLEHGSLCSSRDPTFCTRDLVGQEGFLEEREGAMAPCLHEDTVVL